MNDETDALLTVAKLMVLAARTAPKTKGQDYIVCKIISGEEKEKEAIAREMEKIGREMNKKGWLRDAQNLRDSPALVLVGVRNTPADMDCGACGFQTCDNLRRNLRSAQMRIFAKQKLRAKKNGRDFKGPVCAMRLLDLGIALCSAAKLAGELNADNRIMYRIGVAAGNARALDADVIMGIPLSATGKSPFFDRPV
ncbi:MAG: DUF2148 domain-containing protein [Candidatus Micrarchaeota archaeon]